MTRLVHLTDLHFGLHRTELVRPLQDAVLSVAPDVVVVSGDLTQRALAGQFDQAMAFLRDLGLPFMVIPGNHDLPVFNPLMRVFNGFGPYGARASADLTPVMQIGRLRLFGMNTAHPFKWRGGVARSADVDRICRALQDGPPDAISIAVCHHPLEEPPGFERGETEDAAMAMSRFAAAGLRVTLSGHLHHWSTGLGISGQAGRPVFQMQTGTALCARERERDHGFAVLAFDDNDLSVTPWIVRESFLTFAPRPALAYAYREGLWRLR